MGMAEDDRPVRRTSRFRYPVQRLATRGRVRGCSYGPNWLAIRNGEYSGSRMAGRGAGSGG